MTQPLRHVACLDDEPDILTIAQLALETVGGLEVTIFPNAAIALSTISDAPPDLLLLDSMMPDMDGPTVIRTLHAIPGLEQFPVIFMTANVHPPDVSYYLGLGAIGVIAKPFDPMTLADEVRRIWEARASARTPIFRV